jgi:hypothetical protein
MRYLRHAPFAFWLAVALALGGIVLSSWYAGRDLSTPLVVNKTFGDPRGDAQAMLERVSGVYPSITNLELSSWALETARLADVGLVRHLASGGTTGDVVGQAWAQVADAARNLAVDGPQDASTALTGASRLGQAAQQLAALADGIVIPGPTPDFPTEAPTVTTEPGGSP